MVSSNQPGWSARGRGAVLGQDTHRAGFIAKGVQCVLGEEWRLADVLNLPFDMDDLVVVARWVGAERGDCHD